ncbi:dihydrofolate reductase family protein [Leptolyngbya sp. 7M]|uniref:dihydrofolate reductase family protein n=1 Tax=Leptolyngbya sp. 7M TaxID=2812896 RepID=UPI001B8B7B10|nr:dihydrofolate reductase family protein [Leptolyngbya sp. 7M]QYO68869.1 dihydrofolate reductase family protein [Leptolyngbya sp. 7M]QYU69758.1 dihydrofolate reductase family protein [Leptolyngbya sp. 15MV]
MKTQYYTAASLDGFIATEDDSLEWLFSLGEVSNSSYADFIAKVGSIAMGSTTYRWLLNNAEQVAAQTGSAWPYTCPAWVFSSRPQPIVPGAKIFFVSGDVRAAFPAMRQTAGERNLWIVGGGDLAGQFADSGLLDELIVQVGSVTLGQGRPLLPRRLLSPALRLTQVSRLGPEMVELRYDVRIDAR